MCSLTMLKCWVEKKGTQSTHSLLVAEAQLSIGAILNIKEYSTLCCLVRVMAYVLKAVNLFKGTAQQRQLTLSPAETREAKKLRILCAQGTLIHDKNFKHLQKQLNLFFDNCSNGNVEGISQMLTFLSHYIYELFMKIGDICRSHSGFSDMCLLSRTTPSWMRDSTPCIPEHCMFDIAYIY